MIDYEELILIRQDYLEIYEDEPDSADCPIGYCWWDDLPEDAYEIVFR